MSRIPMVLEDVALVIFIKIINQDLVNQTHLLRTHPFRFLHDLLHSAPPSSVAHHQGVA